MTVLTPFPPSIDTTVQDEILNVSNPQKVAENHSHRATFKTLSLYVFAELLEPGKGARNIKKVVRVGKATGHYTVGNEGSYNRVYSTALEKAVEIAFNHLYGSQANQLNRVFISQFENIEKAKQDPDSLEYSLKPQSKSKKVKVEKC